MNQPIPQTREEGELLITYRESSANDRTMLFGLLMDWQRLSSAHRAVVYKVSDALRSATAWRKGGA